MASNITSYLRILVGMVVLVLTKRVGVLGAVSQTGQLVIWIEQ
jgi:hypothetical protein